MKRRLLITAVFLFAGYSILVGISRAPIRVHIAYALAWLPPIFIGCAVLWSKRLAWGGKVISLLLVLALGALGATYAATQVIRKAEFTAQAYFGMTAFLGIAVAGVGVTTFVCDYVLVRCLRKHQAPSAPSPGP